MLVTGKIRAQFYAAHITHIFNVAMQVVVPIQCTFHTELLWAMATGEFRLFVHQPMDFEPLLGVKFLAALFAQMRCNYETQLVLADPSNRSYIAQFFFFLRSRPIFFSSTYIVPSYAFSCDSEESSATHIASGILSTQMFWRPPCAVWCGAPSKWSWQRSADNARTGTAAFRRASSPNDRVERGWL